MASGVSPVPDIRALLLESTALLEGHFMLSSGRHSNRYLQCARALQHPAVAERLGGEIASVCRDQLEEIPEVVVSPALGGLIIGHEVGRALGVRACFAERVAGSMQLRRGFELNPGERVLMVEDVITTGLSSRETLEVIRQHGGRPVAVACIANRLGAAEIDDLPLLALLPLDAPAWEQDQCPLCAEGSTAVKPGSRAPEGP